MARKEKVSVNGGLHKCRFRPLMSIGSLIGQASEAFGIEKAQLQLQTTYTLYAASPKPRNRYSQSENASKAWE